MILKVLVDNNTLIDRYFLGEPGVSYYIEADGKKILFDLGYSDAFLINGQKLDVDFNALDYVVVSHSHLDHTWGLDPLMRRLTEQMLENKSPNRPTFVAHPMVFEAKSFTGLDEFGMLITQEKVWKYFNNGLSSAPLWITEHLVFLGEIPRVNDFEAQESIGKVLVNGSWIEDFNRDDSALCYRTDKGLVIITGCSHSGICNIVDYARQVCGEDRIVDIIGGFHLMDAAEGHMDQTARYLKSRGIQSMHPCHCTDLKAKIALSSYMEVKEVGSGLILTYNAK